jgi:two-component system cell cycle sensor histidine kinase PleC
VIEDCLRLVRARAENGGVALATALPEALPELFADPRLLKQIMLNLLSNAVKFTPAGGRVTAGAQARADGGLALYVADTGIGMSADEVVVALSPFGQVDGGLARRHEGTGLGLPLAQQLARLHDGDLLIDSAPGIGTTVTVTMPAERVIAEDGAPLAAE